MGLLALTISDNNREQIVVSQETAFIGIKFSSVRELSTLLAKRLEDKIIKIDGVKVVSLDDYCEVYKQVARIEHHLIDLSVDMNRAFIIREIENKLNVNDAELCRETQLQAERTFEADYIPYRRDALISVNDWLEKKKINERTGQNHCLIGQKLTNRIYKALDDRNATQVRELVNPDAHYWTTHITGSHRQATIGEVWLS